MIAAETAKDGPGPWTARHFAAAFVAYCAWLALARASWPAGQLSGLLLVAAGLARGVRPAGAGLRRLMLILATAVNTALALWIAEPDDRAADLYIIYTAPAIPVYLVAGLTWANIRRPWRERLRANLAVLALFAASYQMIVTQIPRHLLLWWEGR